MSFVILILSEVNIKCIGGKIFFWYNYLNLDKKKTSVTALKKVDNVLETDFSFFESILMQIIINI